MIKMSLTANDRSIHKDFHNLLGKGISYFTALKTISMEYKIKRADVLDSIRTIEYWKKHA